MQRVAFCGLGQMGQAMAGRLLEAGHELTVWNRTRVKARPLEDKGARVASAPAEAAGDAEAVITMLADPEAVEEVVFGADGVARGVRPGSVLIEMSTVGPDAVRDLRARLPQEVALLDAPVLGSVPQAEKGELKVMVGGDARTFERCRQILEALGTPRLVGGLGDGAAMKLVVNSTLGAIAAALGEALLLGELLGLDRSTTLDVLEGSNIGSVARSKRKFIESGNYVPNFKLSLAEKDLRLVTEAARSKGIELEVASAARRMLEEASEAGRGEEDYSALVGFILERAPA